MKILSIVRHAKSSWEYPELSDFNRPLLKKGIKRTNTIAGFIKGKALIPDLILSSGAKRAFETGEIIINALALDSCKLEVKNVFYPGSEAAYIDEIKKVDNGIEHLMLIGHNPSLTDLVSVLDNNFSLEWLKTSGLVVFKTNIEKWSDLEVGAMEMLHNVVPKELLK